ncbi:hypothetical protein [Legionella saoudiensis]|uniref:hypothetical protein n=1 Tax=Legionella saoudiensis TaxID=1750561 RepID=UPI000731D0D2|nr:hypothetical protein [Legionella saoudiensis]
MDRSRFLAKAMGIYLLIVSLSIFINMHSFVNLVNEMTKNEPLLFVTGFFTLIIGILLVLSHNIWQWDWRVLITVIAWLTLLKGASLILHPAMLYTYTATINYITAAIDVILGVILCYFGFKHS